jgi:hypothetical protein
VNEKIPAARTIGHQRHAGTTARVSELPVPGDIDADYSPQYVKLTRILRDKIKTEVI